MHKCVRLQHHAAQFNRIRHFKQPYYRNADELLWNVSHHFGPRSFQAMQVISVVEREERMLLLVKGRDLP